MKDDKSRILPLLMDPRQPDENNRAYAYRILRKNIMNIQLQPGCQLSEAELSEHLVMSRTPIHEALMMLKGEWLVDVLPQRGSIVSKISIQYINEGYAMRKMLEPALLRSLSGHLNQAQLSELHGLLERQDGSACISHDVLGDTSSRWTTSSISACIPMPVMTASGRPCTTLLPTWIVCAIWTPPCTGWIWRPSAWSMSSCTNI